MKKAILLILLLFSPALIILFAFGFLFLMIFLNADSSDQLDKMYQEEEVDISGGAYCSPTGEMDIELVESKFKNGAFKGQTHLFIEAAEKYGVDPVFMVAISALETGWGSSEQAMYKNNPGGLKINGVYHTFDTLEAGMESLAKTVHTHVIEHGETDLEDFAAHYAPVGDDMDYNNTNHTWVDSVTSIATSLGGFTMNCTSTGSVDMGDYTVDIKNGFAWVTPHTKHLTSGVGPRWGREHKGIDIAWPGVLGTPVVSMLDGEVKAVNTGCPVGCLAEQGCGTHTCGSGYGNRVEVQHSDGTYTRYAHLQDVLVKEGQKVKIGQLLGTVGSSGHSSGAHLHFEIRKSDESIIDPEKLLMEKGFKFTYN